MEGQYKTFAEFFDNYLATIELQVPNYRELAEFPVDEFGNKHNNRAGEIHKALKPLTLTQIQETILTIKELVKMPSSIVVSYDKNAETFYCFYNPINKRVTICFPTVGYYMTFYNRLLRALILHEMGHILNKDIFSSAPGHNECKNICCDVRINAQINYQDIRNVNKCLFLFKDVTDAENPILVPEYFYPKIGLPYINKQGFDWQTIHTYYHLNDKEQLSDLEQQLLDFINKTLSRAQEAGQEGQQGQPGEGQNGGQPNPGQGQQPGEGGEQSQGDGQGHGQHGKGQGGQGQPGGGGQPGQGSGSGRGQQPSESGNKPGQGQEGGGGQDRSQQGNSHGSQKDGGQGEEGQNPGGGGKSGEGQQEEKNGQGQPGKGQGGNEKGGDEGKEGKSGERGQGGEKGGNEKGGGEGKEGKSGERGQGGEKGGNEKGGDEGKEGKSGERGQGGEKGGNEKGGGEYGGDGKSGEKGESKNGEGKNGEGKSGGGREEPPLTEAEATVEIKKLSAEIKKTIEALEKAKTVDGIGLKSSDIAVIDSKIKKLNNIQAQIDKT